jgi:hypothetical protein
MTEFSDATLLSWLATKPDKLERHLDKHPEDIDRLDRLTALEDRQVAAMGETVVPPDEFAEQVISRITVDPRLREAGSVFADMLSLGFRTLQLVFGSADDADISAADATDAATTNSTNSTNSTDETDEMNDREGRDR